VPDEPSNGELAWRLDQITVLVRDLVSRSEYTTDQRHIERRFTELDRDITEERQAREIAVKETKDQLASATTQSGTNWRQAIYSGLIPGILFLVGMLITISQTRGGK
jgi:hypothetical protein